MIKNLLLVFILLLTWVRTPEEIVQVKEIPQVEDNPVSDIAIAVPRNIGPAEIEQIQEYGTRKAKEQCISQPSLPWCQRNHQKIALEGYEIIYHSLEIKSSFSYEREKEDVWKSSLDLIKDNEKWKGDCDDLTSTTLHQLGLEGQPLDRMWFVLVAVKPSKIFDHMIGLVQDRDGKYWIVGDANRKNFYPPEEIKYEVRAIARLDQLDRWERPASDGPAFP